MRDLRFWAHAFLRKKYIFAIFFFVFLLLPPPTKCSEMTSTIENITFGGGRFVFGRRLGGGAFGEVFLVRSTSGSPDRSDSNVYAAKLEPVNSTHQPHLFHEAKVYSSLAKPGLFVGIPKVRWYGIEGDFNVLVMELVGPSLTELLDFCRGKFEAKTVMMLAHQGISRLQYCHALGYLHRDLKPDNLTMGVGKRSHHLYLIDFGLAKKFMDRNGSHIPFRDGKSLTGTARYVSIATHKGLQQARRDDLESFAHVLIFLAKGLLPWQAVRSTSKSEKYEKIMAMKIATPPTVLCSRLPSSFHKFLSYSRSLKFEEEPNYDYCRQLFEADMKEKQYDFDYQYCWITQGAALTTDSSSIVLNDGGSTVAAQSGTSRKRNSTRSSSYVGRPAGYVPPTAQTGFVRPPTIPTMKKDSASAGRSGGASTALLLGSPA